MSVLSSALPARVMKPVEVKNSGMFSSPATSCCPLLSGFVGVIESSLLAIHTCSLLLFTWFQNWSTARTLTSNSRLAVWVTGVPILPSGSGPPGWDTSPGNRTMSRSMMPGVTSMVLTSSMLGVMRSAPRRAWVVAVLRKRSNWARPSGSSGVSLGVIIWK